MSKLNIKSNNASNKLNNANSIKECKTKICEQFLPMEYKKNSQRLIAHFTKKMNPKEKKEYIDNMNKIKPKTLSKKQLKTEIDSCMHFYCNKGCKGSIFEDGKGSDYPKLLEKNDKKIKLDKAIIDYLKLDRIKIFKNKTSVLKDNFYEKLNRNKVKLLKSHKAISGCGYAI